jgi:hypothetical protein
LITAIGDIYCHGGGRCVGLMVARGAVHGAPGRGRLLIIGDFPFPAPFTSVFRHKRCGATTVTAEFHEENAVISDLVTCVGRRAAFFTQAELHLATPENKIQMLSKRQKFYRPIECICAGYKKAEVLQRWCISHAFYLSRQKEVCHINKFTVYADPEAI